MANNCWPVGDSNVMDGRELRERVLDWMRQCQRGNPEGTGYAISAIAPDPTIMSLCFAVLITELYDALPGGDQRDQWCHTLISVQDPETGLFIDPLLHPGDLRAGNPGRGYLVHQTTYFALNALDALDARPVYPLRYADPYCDPAFLKSWLEGLDWSNPWRESNWVMFIAASLYVKWQWEDNHAARVALGFLLDWLDAHQDPETGFWGTRQGASLLHAMAGGYHFLPFYFCLGRPIHHPERMIESTLSLQQPDGLFHPQGGGDACLDVDAVGILVQCSLVTPHHGAAVQTALERTFHGLLSNRSEDGGFCRARLRPLPPKSWKRRVGETFGLDRLLRKPYRPPCQIMYYEGWTKMPFDVRQSDLWSTWFRSFGLGVIGTVCADTLFANVNWQFRRIPGVGWHDVGLIRAQSRH